MIPKELYKQIVDAVPICTVDVLLFNADLSQTLLFLRTNEPLKGVYFSLGGGLKKNEKFLDCAVRQCKKEVGIDIDRDRLVFGGVLEEIHPNSAFENVSYHCVNIVYGYIFNHGRIMLDSQHAECKWFDVGDSSLHFGIKTKINTVLSAMAKTALQ